MAGERRRPDAACPLRMDQPCNLCHPDAMVGPQDCPTVDMVMHDPELRAMLNDERAAYKASHPA